MIELKGHIGVAGRVTSLNGVTLLLSMTQRITASQGWPKRGQGSPDPLTSTQLPLFSPAIQFLSFALHLREMPSNGKSPPSGSNQVEQSVMEWFKWGGGDCRAGT
jgi:hypothetical protein